MTRDKGLCLPVCPSSFLDKVEVIMSALYVSILPKKQTLPIELLLFIPINVYWGVNSCSVPYWSHAQQKHSPIHAVDRSSSECFGILSVSCLELATEMTYISDSTERCAAKPIHSVEFATFTITLQKPKTHICDKGILAHQNHF